MASRLSAMKWRRPWSSGQIVVSESECIREMDSQKMVYAVSLGSSASFRRTASLGIDRLVEYDLRKRSGEEHWIETAQADVFFGAIILINALVTGIDIEIGLRFGNDSVQAQVVYVVQCILTVTFMVELILRVRARGCQRTLCSIIFAFDFVIVLVSVADLCLWGFGGNSVQAVSALRILQLLRFVRMVRLFKVSRALFKLLRSLTMSLRAVFWVFLLLFGVTYIGALFCAMELGHSEHAELRHAFGSMGSSFYTHFKLMTFEQWPDICTWALEESPLWVLYLLCYMALTNLALINLMTGLIMDGVVKNSKEDDWSSELHACEAGPFHEKFVAAIADLELKRKFESVEEEEVPDGVVDAKKFDDLLHNPFVQDILNVYQISLRIPPNEIFQVLDVDGKGRISVKELCLALLQLRGSRERLHPLLVRRDVHVQSVRLMKSVSRRRMKLVACYRDDLLSLQTKFAAQVAVTAGATEAALHYEAGRRPRPGAEADRNVAGTDGDDVESVSSEDPLPRPAPPERRASGGGQGVPVELDGRLATLLRDAAACARSLDGAVCALDDALQETLAREATLAAQVSELEAWEATEAESERSPQRALDFSPTFDGLGVDYAIDIVLSEQAHGATPVRVRRDLRSTFSSPGPGRSGPGGLGATLEAGAYCPAPRLLAAMRPKSAGSSPGGESPLGLLSPVEPLFFTHLNCAAAYPWSRIVSHGGESSRSVSPDDSRQQGRMLADRALVSPPQGNAATGSLSPSQSLEASEFVSKSRRLPDRLSMLNHLKNHKSLQSRTMQARP